MKKLWKRRPRLNASPQPIAIASAANDSLWVCEISTTASTNPTAQAAIGTPGQRMTRRFSGLSGRKLIRALKGIDADRSQHFGHRFAAALLPVRDGWTGRRAGPPAHASGA